METRFAPAGVPIAFVAGLFAAFLGATLGTHDESWVSHLPHQLLIAVPLAVLVAMVLRANERELWLGAGMSALGLAVGAALLVLAGAH